MNSEIRQLDFADLDQIYVIASQVLVPLWSRDEYGFFLKQTSSFCWGMDDSFGLASFILTLVSGSEMDIVSVATRKDVQGKRLASDLVGTLLKRPDIKRAFLEVDPMNAPAVKLYLGLGFQVQGVRKKYYQGKKDAWMMKWER